MESDIRILEVEPVFEELKFRVPLKFGTGVVEKVTSYSVRVKVENKKERVADGRGNVLLSYLWAWPSETLSADERDTVMRDVCLKYCKVIENYKEYAHPIDIFFDVKADLLKGAAEAGEEHKLKGPVPELAALNCASPIDAALHDAFGRANEICSYAGLGPDFMGRDLSHYLGPDFHGEYLSRYVKKYYEAELPVFHLCGGLDKLTEDEISDDDPKDGLPVSLDQWIRRDGIFCFKVKLRGDDIDWDVERTKAVTEVARRELAKLGVRDFYLSGDSNEVCESPEYVIEYLNKLREVSPLALKSFLYYEQPTERDMEARKFDMRELSKIKPVIVDESVTDPEKLERAIELGWSGVALKTCKGQSSTLMYVARAAKAGLIYSVQDLTNPGLSLVQSAGLAARTSPVMGVEYNARQYIPRAHRDVQRRHPELFKVAGGKIKTHSIGNIGLGY